MKRFVFSKFAGGREFSRTLTYFQLDLYFVFYFSCQSMFLVKVAFLTLISMTKSYYKIK